ncbi:MAG: winged helix-turn-helix transcriptional regulator [Thermoplasmata archaeon]
MPKDLMKRKLIYEVIENNPGIHFRELLRKLNLNVGDLQYHLDVLEKQYLIISKEESGYKRYYPRVMEKPEEKKYLPFLRQSIPRKIIIIILENDSADIEMIENETKLNRNTIFYHIKKMLNNGIINKIEKEGKIIYSVNNSEEVARTIIKYKESFQDKVVDKFIEFWERS